MKFAFRQKLLHIMY
uniref:Uncharacterized protein n=1 Tax=Anguilla anguilla TaxID=7936 RepID=A0A0E9QVF5_ANGAN